MRLLLTLCALILFSVLPVNARQPARVQSDINLNLRSAPNTDSPTLMTLQPRTDLTAIGRTRDGGWVQVATDDDIVGWVAATYIELSGSPDDLPVTYTFDRAADGVPELDERINANLTQIAQIGRSWGNDPHRFAKIGDSITVAPHFLTPITTQHLILDEYTHLQTVIDHFTQSGDAFSRVSQAAAIGWTSSAVLDPTYANADVCLPDETPLDCEYRLYRPAVALIMYGTNDVAHLGVTRYEANLKQIIAISTNAGVIPILSTIPEREDYEDQVRAFNNVVRTLGYKYAVPVWDYGAALSAIAGGGLDEDGVHPSIPPRGLQGSADFRARNLPYGYVIRNLTALTMLQSVMPILSTAYDFP